MKNSKQKSVSKTVCGIDNPEVASENSATPEVQDVLSQILREGAQKMLQSAIQKEVNGPQILQWRLRNLRPNGSNATTK